MEKQDTSEVVAKKYTPQEIAELLTDCVLVKEKYWHLIPIGSTIRYYRNDTEPDLSFKRGGYVNANYPQSDGSFTYCLSNSYKGKQYKVNSKVFSKVYKKIDNRAIIDIMMIKDSLAEIREKLAKLENNT